VALYLFLRVWQSERTDAEGLLATRTDADGLRGVLGNLHDVDRLRARGEHMLATLVDLVHRGERVFAVVGSGHVIRQEPALRKALE
jgi:hypothetical protein